MKRWSIAIKHYFKFHFRIPPPNLKAFPYLNEVIADAIAIGIVAFAISVSMAKIFANKHDYAVDSNQVQGILCSMYKYLMLSHSICWEC